MCESAHAGRGIASQLDHVCFCVSIKAMTAAFSFQQSIRMSVKSLCDYGNGCGKNVCYLVCCGAVKEIAALLQLLLCPSDKHLENRATDRHCVLTQRERDKLHTVGETKLLTGKQAARQAG